MKLSKSYTALKPCITFSGYYTNEDGSNIVRMESNNRKIKVNSFLLKKKYPCRWVNIKVNNKFVNFAVAKLVSDAYITPYKRGQVVKHMDGNTLNDHYTNLKVYRSYNYESEEVNVTNKTLDDTGNEHEKPLVSNLFVVLFFIFILLLLIVFTIALNIHHH